MERRGGGGKESGGWWDGGRELGKRREQRKGRREKRRKLPFIRSSHLQPNTTLTEILSIKFGVKIVSDVLSTEPGTKTLGTVTYTELLTGMSEEPNLSQRGIIPC